MYRELQAFLKIAAIRRSARASPRESSKGAPCRRAIKRGIVSITVTVKDGDFDYAARKIIQMVHEIFMIFLVDGPYFEYMVEQLGLDPDRY